MYYIDGEQIIYSKCDAERPAKHEKNTIDAAKKSLSLFHKLALLSVKILEHLLIIAHNDINRYTF